MLAAGMGADAIVKAVEDMEASATPVKTARQMRNARYYEGRKASEKRLKASYSDHSDAPRLNSDRPRARVEDKTSNSEIEPQEKKQTAQARDVAAFRSELSDLDAERLDGLIKLRKSKRAPVTALSARLFRKDAAACGLSLAEAADTCISRNWTTVKPEYGVRGNAQARGSPAGRPPNVVDLTAQLLRDMEAADERSKAGIGSDQQAALTISTDYRQRVG